MTLHFPDQVDTNLLTIDATDPRSGTAEFKAAAIRVEKMPLDGEREAEPEAVAAGNGELWTGKATVRPASATEAARGRRAMDLRLLLAVATDAERRSRSRARDAAVNARAQGPGRGPHRSRRPRGARAPPPAAARAPGRAGASGLDQRGRARAHQRAPDGAARGRLRRGHLLRPPQRGAAPAACAARVRGPRLPLPGSEELIAELEQRLGPEDRTTRAGSPGCAAPASASATAAPAALLTIAGEAPEEHVLAPVEVRGAIGALHGEGADWDPPARAPQEGVRRAAAAATRGPRPPHEHRRLPLARRLRRAAQGARARPARA